MTVAPKDGHGVQLKIGNAASPEVFTAIGRIISAAVNGRELNIIEFTTHDVDYVQKLSSFINNGQLSLVVGYDSSDTQHELLETKFEAKAKVNFQLVLPDTGARQFAFNAFVKSLSYNSESTDVGKMNVTLEVCETWTAS